MPQSWQGTCPTADSAVIQGWHVSSKHPKDPTHLSQCDTSHRIPSKIPWQLQILLKNWHHQQVRGGEPSLLGTTETNLKNWVQCWTPQTWISWRQSSEEPWRWWKDWNITPLKKNWESWTVQSEEENISYCECKLFLFTLGVLHWQVQKIKTCIWRELRCLEVSHLCEFIRMASPLQTAAQLYRI